MDLESRGPSDGAAPGVDIGPAGFSAQTHVGRRSRDRVVFVRTDAGICRRRRCDCDHDRRCARHRLEFADLPGTSRTDGVVDRPDRCATRLLVDWRDPGDIIVGKRQRAWSRRGRCGPRPVTGHSPARLRCASSNTVKPLRGSSGRTSAVGAATCRAPSAASRTARRRFYPHAHSPAR